MLLDLTFRLNTAKCIKKNLVNVIVQLTKIIENPLTEDDVQYISRIPSHRQKKNVRKLSTSNSIVTCSTVIVVQFTRRQLNYIVLHNKI